MDESWYIHLHDPQFFDDPWPGQRRIGPFNSEEEATEQAANDLARGMGEGTIGVFTGQASDDMRESTKEALGDMSENQKLEHAQDRDKVNSLVAEEPAVDLDTLKTRAEELQQEWDTTAETGLDDFRESFRATLPENLQGDEELISSLMKVARMV